MLEPVPLNAHPFIPCNRLENDVFVIGPEMDKDGSLFDGLPFFQGHFGPPDICQ